ncbi:hypothetical protein AAC387_Pa07g1782 [Persea americana]
MAEEITSIAERVERIEEGVSQETQIAHSSSQNAGDRRIRKSVVRIEKSASLLRRSLSAESVPSPPGPLKYLINMRVKKTRVNRSNTIRGDQLSSSTRTRGGEQQTQEGRGPLAPTREGITASNIVRSDKNKILKDLEESLDPNWVSKINERRTIEPRKLKASSSNISCSIHRVPRKLRLRNENVFDPEVISIGPLHYEKREGQLKAMEEHKWRYLHDILSRNPQVSLERYLISVKELEGRARDCYSEVIDQDSHSFVEMMLLDGCFIIEFFRKAHEEDHDGDPIFELEWLAKAVMADLFMLENQIPFFILQCLFSLMIVGCSPSPSLVEWAFRIYGQWDSGMENRINNSDIQILHLLHLMHTSYIIDIKEKYPEQGLVIIPSASKLEAGGIKLRKPDDDGGSTTTDSRTTELSIKFQNGVLEIPPLQIWDKTNVGFLNFIAFEQCYCHCKKYFTAYTTFMDCLINTNKDVAILCRNRIIDSWLGSEEDLVAVYNNMGREVIKYDEDFYLAGVCKEINRYSNKVWPKMRSTLVHDYFKNPWAIISFFAALLLLLLSMTQTFFSAFPKFAYHRK